MDWVDAVSIAGSILSLLGVAIAAAQIRKTRLAAEAAAEAARKTQSAIRRSVLLADVATFLRTLEEIKVYVRTEGYESALSG